MRTLLSLILLAQALPAPPARGRRAARESGVYAVVAEVDRLAARTEFWPSFDPRRVPVAIYDGHATLLFRHPAPPPEFISLSSRFGVYAVEGRHEAVTANAPVRLGGVWTATAMLTPERLHATRESAALVVHEMFHVFQRERHAGWAANEAELFNYPFEDAEVLRLRRLETAALARADSARSKAGSACWASAAVGLRRERFARMPAGSAAYERGTELNEGLARYVESLAAGGPRRANLPAEEFAVEAVRTRAYGTGAALARLLDRFAPGWKRRLEAGDKRPLDELLEAALPGARPSAAATLDRCSFDSAERERTARRAQADVAGLVAAREESKRAFLALAGWRVVVEAAEGAPLSLQSFDPLNVRRVTPEEVLHTRFLRLGNGAGAVEILGRASLTEGAGAHPLFNGVRRLFVTGMEVGPSVEESDGKLKIAAAGLKAEFTGAEVSREGRTLRVRLKK